MLQKIKDKKLVESHDVNVVVLQGQIITGVSIRAQLAVEHTKREMFQL